MRPATTHSCIHVQAFLRPRSQHRSLRACVCRSAGAVSVPAAHATSSTSCRARGTRGQFDTIDAAVDAIARGEFVLVLDDEGRENEGDLIIAAEHVTPAKIAYMVEHTSGVLCVAMTGTDCQRLELPLMVPSKENTESMHTAFTVTVDLRSGVTTGISASDRCKTIRALADPRTEAADLRRPGHIFPLIAHDGGVLSRPGHTEAAVDLAQLAGCTPAGVICEVVDRSSGEMARTPQLLQMAEEHGLTCITIEDLIVHRSKLNLPTE